MAKSSTVFYPLDEQQHTKPVEIDTLNLPLPPVFRSCDSGLGATYIHRTNLKS
mgnify:CR=1 FL=1